MNMKELAELLAAPVKVFVAERLGPIVDRLRALEERPPVIERGERGEKGEKGDNGVSIKGDPGKDGEKGIDGRNGTDGKDGEKGADGKDGERGADGRNGVDGKDGQKGADGRDGSNGKDGARGEKGEPGEEGRDALMIDVLPGIDELRSYPPRTYASHNGGLWISRRKTKGMDGWECLVNGINSVEERQIDERTVERVTTLSSGAACKLTMSIPTPIDRGIYQAEKEYVRGDGVTFGGSWWICQVEKTKARPGEDNSDWRLAVKRGRDAKGKL